MTLTLTSEDAAVLSRATGHHYHAGALTCSAFEAGVLLGAVAWTAPNTDIYAKLWADKLRQETDAGVVRTWRDDGTVQLRDADGNTIVREAYPREREFTTRGAA